MRSDRQLSIHLIAPDTLPDTIQNVLEIGQIAYFVIDFESNVFSYSMWFAALAKRMQMFRTPFDSSPQQITLKEVAERVLIPEDYQAFIEMVEEEDTRKKRGVFHLKSSSETSHVIFVESFPILSEDNKTTKFQVGMIRDITEEKRKETQIRDQQTALSQALKAGHCARWECDLQTRMVTLSDEAASFLNYVHGEKYAVADIIANYHPDDRETVRKNIDELIETGKPFDINARMYYGENRDLAYLQLVGVLDGTGTEKPSRILGLVRNRTRDVFREKVLENSEARYRAIFEQSGDAIAVMDGEIFMECNEKMLALYGVDHPEGILGRNIREFAPRMQNEKMSSKELSLKVVCEIEAKGGQSFEWLGNKADGTLFYTSAHLSQIPYETDKTLQLLILRDITDLKFNEKAVRYNQSYLHVLAAMRHHIYGRTEQKIISTFLESITEQFGFAKSWYGECIGNLIRPILHAEPHRKLQDVRKNKVEYFDGELMSPLFQAIREKKIITRQLAESELEWDPSFDPVEAENFPSLVAIGLQINGRDEGGMVFYCHEPIIDQRILEYLQNGLEELSRIISEKRLWEEQRRALRYAKEKAELAVQAKSHFLANMSHEIRTPMTSILGYTELLTDPLIPRDKIKDSVQIIKNNAEFLLHIINDILDYSKIEADMAKVELHRCRVDMFLAEIASLFHVKTSEKKLRFVIKNQTPFPQEIISDPMRLKQILVNLVGNAIKFTSEGSVDIVVSWEGYSGEEFGHLKIEVRDTGIGISKRALQTIFSPFEQGDNSTTRRFGGTGLGLAISQRLVKLLGGELTVESRKGEGSCFTILLPQLVSNTTQWSESINLAISLADQKDVQKPGTNRQELASVKILLAEDGKDNQRLFTLILEKSGAAVQIAQNGAEAVKMALDALNQGNPFDIILMDMQMPVMDGYSATVELRQHNYHRPIVALTAHAMPEERIKCLAAGCNNFITKPIMREALITAVQNDIAQYASQIVPLDMATLQEGFSAPSVDV